MNAKSSLTINDWLASTKQKLGKVGIETTELDALVLMQDALQQNKAFILAHSENVLTNKQLQFLEKNLARRLTHEPLAYIRGHAEFYGRDFLLDNHVLVPRPETETMIELLKQLTHKNIKLTIVDVGTGSGNIAITAQLELSALIVYATDIDKKCLSVSKKNNRVFNTTVNFYHGDLLDPVADQQIDIVLANLPYVPNDFSINKAALKEPCIAIFGGKDGLDLYRHLFEQIRVLNHKPRHILTESLPMQHTTLNKIAEQANYKLTSTDDFIQIFSVA